MFVSRVVVTLRIPSLEKKSYEKEHYQQTFGCAMGSPVSATIANLVMEYIEESAIATATHPPRWVVQIRGRQPCVS